MLAVSVGSDVSEIRSGVGNGLRRALEIAQVVVHQYGPEFCMTDCELAVSTDAETYAVMKREQKATPVTWAVRFPARQARFVRITSLATVRPLYPTTFYEVEVYAPGEEVDLEASPSQPDERSCLAVETRQECR